MAISALVTIMTAISIVLSVEASASLIPDATLSHGASESLSPGFPISSRVDADERSKRSLSDMAQAYLMNEAKKRMGLGTSSGQSQPKPGTDIPSAAGNSNKSDMLERLMGLLNSGKSTTNAGNGSTGGGGLLQTLAKNVMG